LQPLLNPANHIFYPTIFAFGSRIFGPPPGNSTPFLPGWQSTGRAERKGSLWENCPKFRLLLDPSASHFLSDHFCVLQPNFRPLTTALLFAAELSAPPATALLSCLVGKVLDEQILHGEACVDVHALHGDSLHALVLEKMKQNAN
jgi:hypothetical protein